ncbi:SMI1/KNR4 family protein [Aquimarina sp. 2304DJ70-9]|uniref:SMI1/KNR4 family protein n=1 Tax=Aquimarina penaris TaxID=3231044 RepID=UPI003462CD22
MKKKWDEIIKYWKGFDTVSLDSLNSGASLDELLLLESYIGQTLPKKFKDFYQIHNGWKESVILPHPSQLLSTEEILDQWNLLNRLYNNEVYEEDEYYQSSSGTKEVKKVKWNKNWIPYTRCSRGRDFYCLDFDPSDHGVKGQILFFSIDLGDREFVSTSFEQWIENYVHNLLKERKS